MQLSTFWRAATTNYANGRAGHRVQCVVLHATVGSLKSAIAHFINPRSRVSSHYLIGRDGRIFCMVEESDTAYHAGDADWRGHTAVNEISIGIELENKNTGTDPYPQPQVDALHELCADILHRYGLTPDAITTHADVARPPGRKSDPAGFDVAALRARLGADPFAAWGPIDPPAGDQRGWAIPQTWLRNQWLGRCLLGEFWPVADVCSVACFERGCIVYEKAADKARLVRFGGEG